MESPAKPNFTDEETSPQIEQAVLRLTSVFSGDSKVFTIEIANLKEKLEQQKAWIDKLFLLTEGQEKLISQNQALGMEKISSLQLDTQDRLNKETKEMAEALDRLTEKLSEVDTQVVHIKAEASGKKDYITTIIAIIGAVSGIVVGIDMILGKLG